MTCAGVTAAVHVQVCAQLAKLPIHARRVAQFRVVPWDVSLLTHAELFSPPIWYLVTNALYVLAPEPRIGLHSPLHFAHSPLQPCRAHRPRSRWYDVMPACACVTGSGGPGVGGGGADVLADAARHRPGPPAPPPQVQQPGRPHGRAQRRCFANIPRCFLSFPAETEARKSSLVARGVLPEQIECAREMALVVHAALEAVDGGCRTNGTMTHRCSVCHFAHRRGRRRHRGTAHAQQHAPEPGRTLHTRHRRRDHHRRDHHHRYHHRRDPAVHTPSAVRGAEQARRGRGSRAAGAVQRHGCVDGCVWMW